MVVDPVTMKVVETALEQALAAVTNHLARARAEKSANVAACLEYLGAAQTAIEGLEDEADQIFIEAKMVARFYWDQRAALYERIDRYLTRDRLRPLLDQAIQGIKSCNKFMERDATGFFQRPEKAEAVAEVRRLLEELSGYMDSLGSVMSSSRENYISPSGINVPELLDIQTLLLSPPGSTDESRQRITELAETTQRRVKSGFPLVAQGTGLIQELTVVFALQRRSAG